MEEKDGIIVHAGHFDLEQICRSGQCFRMESLGAGRFRVVAGRRYLELEQQGAACRFFCGSEDFSHFWKDYFDLGQDYQVYLDRIDPADSYLKEAAAFGSGMRILRQELWEMIVSFLISQQNNLVRIRRCIGNICEKYGERLVNERGEAYYAFPEPEALAGLAEDGLFPCNLGYRSKYVVRAARDVVEGKFDLEAVGQMSYKDAMEALLGLFGVGEKVAGCICLFGLHHLEAFPVDTHIRQALERQYPKGFPFERYAGVQGVVQQYIFYYELMGLGRKKQ